MADPPKVSVSPSSSNSSSIVNSAVPLSSFETTNLSATIGSLRINDTSSSVETGTVNSGCLGPSMISQESESIPVNLLSSSSSNHQNETLAQPKLKAILPGFLQCTYTPCYCEENIWLLCDKIRTEYSSELVHCVVVFISNPKRMVPLWRQKSGKTEDKLAIWDYHVILLYNPDDRCVVYDMDSDLPFPTHFHKYVTETFRTESVLQPEYHRFFRLLNGPDFLNLFSSDRSHMVKGDGSYVHPPPPYPPIYTHGVNNLEEFVDMTYPSEKTEFGEVLNLMDLVRRYYKSKRPSS